MRLDVRVSSLLLFEDGVDQVLSLLKTGVHPHRAAILECVSSTRLLQSGSGQAGLLGLEPLDQTLLCPHALVLGLGFSKRGE